MTDQRRSHISAERLPAYVEECLFQRTYPHVQQHVAWFQQRFVDSLLAVIFYGSCLAPETISKTSAPDFYLIVRSYQKAHPHWIHRLLNYFLPPSIYLLSLQGEYAKYNVIRKLDYQKATSGRSSDIYNLGRLSKRFAVLYAHDENVRKLVAQSYLTTCDKVIAMALPLLPKEFSLQDLIKKALALSYIGETRVEADDKVDRLFAAEQEFYLPVFELRFRQFCAANPNYTYDPGSQTACYRGGTIRRRWQAMQVSFFLWQSKLRTVLRWPKYAFTFENWVDYLLAKIERTKGHKIELTARERKYPFIFGWKHFWQLKRKGYFK